MILLENVNKYFNKNKKNEIHVINNTSLELGDNGLVALIGSSGSGKTTLLNAIGGLDKISVGKIYINDKLISTNKSYKTDNIRNLEIGYIFQDYKLIENLSVYDNVALVLKMIGIKDIIEIKKRVEFVLDKVGILRYKRRPVSTLSGGERQRVGIARAIVKDPLIILADEPTGNLDSKNSLEIMKIIKSISKDKLVILVTHEKSLASFYASRIIEIKDGLIIKDYLNNKKDALDYEIDNNIYLKDFSNIKNIDDENKINIYKNNDLKLNIDIVIKNGNIYIKSNNKLKPEVIDENSSMELIDDNYKFIKQDDINDYQFNFDEVADNGIKKKYSSVTSLLSSIINGFKTVFKFSITKKLLLIGFAVSGMFIMYSLSSLTAAIRVDEKDFVTINKNYLEIMSNNYTIEEYNEIESISSIDYIIPGDSIVYFLTNYGNDYQTAKIDAMLSGSLTSIDKITSEDLIYGVMPKNINEVLIDEATFSKISDNDLIVMSGIKSYKDMVGKKLRIPGIYELEIVGITGTSSPSIYADESLFNIILTYGDDFVYGIDSTYYKELIDYNELDIELVEGTLPINDYETIVAINMKEEYSINSKISNSIINKELKVVGYYKSNIGIRAYLVNSNTFKYNLVTRSKDISVMPIDKNKAIEELRNNEVKVIDSYAYSKDVYITGKTKSTMITLGISLIILAISLIEAMLMIRSSFLARIKEIGILRAIGIKKSDIYKIFMGEIIAITLLSSLPGIIFMAYILNTINSVGVGPLLFMVNPLVVFGVLIITLLFNVVFGLVPVMGVLGKTPAQILSRYDID